MARYIDAQKLKKRIDCYPPSIREAAMNAVAHTKTEDVAPVRHGRWVDVTPVRHGRWTVTPIFIKCSECGETFTLIPQNYCPNCGAKMDGDADV